MKIEVRHVQNVAIIKPNGKITIGIGDVLLREAVVKCLDEGDRNILVSMGAVTNIDSSGIGELVSAYKTVSNRGGKLKLCKLPSIVSDILMVTQLISVFEVSDSEQEAIDSF